MGGILIIYYSVTGNTKKIAEAIHSAVEGDKTILPLKDVDAVDDFDLVFVGFPVHSHSLPFTVEKFLKKIPRGKKIALFSTHGSLTGSRLSREALEYAMVVASHTRLLGTFSCRGKVSPAAMEVLSRSPEHKVWAEMAVSARRHPDKHDEADAQTFARWIITLSHQG